MTDSRYSTDLAELREKVARVIHPIGFEEDSMERISVVEAYRKEALAKADKILAILSNAQAGGDCVFMPLEPTQKIIDCMTSALTGHEIPDDDYDEDMRTVYKAAVASMPRGAGIAYKVPARDDIAWIIDRISKGHEKHQYYTPSLLALAKADAILALFASSVPSTSLGGAAHPDCPCKPGKCIYPGCTCAIPSTPHATGEG